jgi:hypothetical protein
MNATQVGMGLARGAGQGRATPAQPTQGVPVNVSLFTAIVAVLIVFLLLFVELPIQ